MGDGELAEGQVWEAVTATSFYKPNNLIVIIDYNKLQSTGFIKDRYNLGNLKKGLKLLAGIHLKMSVFTSAKGDYRSGTLCHNQKIEDFLVCIPALVGLD